MLPPKAWFVPERFTGGRCRELRLRFGIHVHHLADTAHVDRAFLQRWEKGRALTPDVQFREAIQTALRSLVVEAALETAMHLTDGLDPRLAHLRLLPTSAKRLRSPMGRFHATQKVVLK
jgi:transcriptional regulator with XRE-family HTH domain